MSPKDAPISIVTGRRQARALRTITVLALVTAGTSLVAPPPLDRGLAVAALGVVMATPVLRVVWLIFRWAQERDTRFVALGTALIAVIAMGALASALGLGR